MRLAATTLVRDNEAIVQDALSSSTRFVDLFVLIDTGCSDDTIAKAREVAGDRLVVLTLPWPDDFSAARNFALKAAAETGCTWAMTLDSDERMIVPDPNELERALARASEEALLVSNNEETYTKPRFFRMPSKGAWVGRTHEAFITPNSTQLERSIASFVELPKNEEEARRKFERDVALLKKSVERDPNDPRWWFYLGQSYEGLKMGGSAVDAYAQCAALRGWSEESAWACFRAAWCLYELGLLEDALEHCVCGFSRHTGMAELAWLAGFICYQLGRDNQACFWAHLAIELGLFRGSVPARTSFKHPPALWEGPYDVLRWAHKRLGNTEEMAAAEELYREALDARVRLTR